VSEAASSHLDKSQMLGVGANRQPAKLMANEKAPVYWGFFCCVWWISTESSICSTRLIFMHRRLRSAIKAFLIHLTASTLIVTCAALLILGLYF